MRKVFFLLIASFPNHILGCPDLGGFYSHSKEVYTCTSHNGWKSEISIEWLPMEATYIFGNINIQGQMEFSRRLADGVSREINNLTSIFSYYTRKSWCEGNTYNEEITAELADDILYSDFTGTYHYYRDGRNVLYDFVTNFKGKGSPIISSGTVVCEPKI